MAAEIPGVFEDSLSHKIKSSKVLVVGAGGIGCELLKNLVLVGFSDIEIMDLDTIDVTNLNRQFLFQKQHVGKSKSTVARESALSFNPNVMIKSYHDTVLNPEYGVSFYKRFILVLNALDNRSARNHVNRMCLAAEIPLVESGTAGYLGQVTVIKKGLTECYECQPKPRQKTYPGCTIRNTPSEPIHCIVWAKHLFNQLFGEADADEDVSPDREDPEAKDEESNGNSKDTGNVERISTRQWAQETDYDAKKIFKKLFTDDIRYLLSMDKLWSKRTPPTPLEWDELSDENGNSVSNGEGGIKDQEIWNIKRCAQVLEDSINQLKKQFKALSEGDHLVWDKDDDAAMDFVTACANIRARIFSIPNKSRFDVKSMAGNIIPAIATTNAVIAGCIVMEAIKILNDDIKSCRTIYLTKKPNPRKKILVPCDLIEPNPKCYVCSNKPQVSIKLNLKTMTVKQFEERILKKAFNMVAPDAEIEGRGVIFISSEAGETESNHDKALCDLNLVDGSIVSCDDFMQEYNLKVILYHSEELDDGLDFELVSGDISKLIQEQPSTSKKESEKAADDDVLEIVEQEKTPISSKSLKRIAEEENSEVISKKPKKMKEDDESVISID